MLNADWLKQRAFFINFGLPGAELLNPDWTSRKIARFILAERVALRGLLDGGSFSLKHSARLYVAASECDFVYRVI